MERERKILELEKRAIENSPRINFLNNILKQVPKIVKIDCIKFDRNNNFLYRKEKKQNILDFVLNAGLEKKSTPTTEHSMETSYW